MNGYIVWLAHGEQPLRRRQHHQLGESSSATPFVMEEQCNDPIRDMVMDANLHGMEYNMNEQASDEPIFEEAMGDAKEFFDLLQAADMPLYDGCDDGDTILKRWMKPEDRDRIPKDFYSTKKMMKRFSLGYKKYDVCVNNCFLYYGEYENKNYIACPICGEPRYKQGHVQQNQHIPRKSLWYLPITPRLKRLYMCRKTTEHMIWHLNCGGVSEKIMHPAGVEAWKHFDRTYPDFASDLRNVRLGLCTDGFTPFGHTSAPYSCWPVFFTVYNLPPAMCMKSESIFFSLIIQGPQSPRKNIDVLLRPLIDELKELWYNRVKTYDSFRHEHFIMRVALMWTITDFPGYDMEIWQVKIVETICQLERIFLPSFFDSMEHLAIHLPYEAKVGGPVQFHWMHPFERAKSIIEMPNEQEDQHDEQEPIFQDDDPLPPQPTETDLIFYQPIQHTDGTISAINVEFEDVNDDREFEDEYEEEEFEHYSTSEEDNIEYISEKHRDPSFVDVISAKKMHHPKEKDKMPTYINEQAQQYTERLNAEASLKYGEDSTTWPTTVDAQLLSQVSGGPSKDGRLYGMPMYMDPEEQRVSYRKRDARRDAGGDARRNVEGDARRDARRDAKGDAGMDAGRDAGMDAKRRRGWDKWGSIIGVALS
ncbi:hypothetical protein SLEP1_g19022 [Rubroshorea leprosula]|nr:hypothetical protein SLEP1_g19022 [Rubroshorea leprosula]